MHGSGDYFSIGIFSVLKEKYVLGKGCCFHDLCLEDFAVVHLGSLGKMGRGRPGCFWEIGPYWNDSAFRLVCCPLLSNRDWGCDRESVCS